MGNAHLRQRRPRLYELYKQFTHGGDYWRDRYLLEHWDQCVQPVVYRNDVHHGYKLLRRLGDWCWLTRDPHPRFKNITFDAIVYPTTGSSLSRIFSKFEYNESPDLPLSIERRESCIRQVVCGMSELHNIGVVHGDLHPGNVALAQPSKEHIEQFLARSPLEHDIRRKNGFPPPPHLPQRVSEPEDIGFGPGDIKIIDFGHSFMPVDGEFYNSNDFPSGTLRPPELLGRDKRTNQPFKADSWYLGQLIYFVLTDGWPIFRRPLVYTTDDLVNEYNIRLAKLKNGHDALINELPEDIRSRFAPLILALLETDPDRRLLIRDITQDERLMDAKPR
ncbi:Protein kinase-like domain protein [Tolypocladium paradoxum]|uniref:Protein kinase-like domain protein n=1 Tax=Tolypocladium paradoxum TaxID=94208 RepID=A0A2S4KTK2_9HYPO|nr:Protein kinase-like domain protein [Tolypocladium paradoxum]